MAVKKIRSLDSWRELIDPFKIEQELIRRKTVDYLRISFYMKENAEKLLESLDFAHLESNFQQAVSDSNLEPKRDPYDWLMEIEHIDLLYKGDCLEPFKNFSPRFDWIFKGYLYELTGQHRNISVFPPEHIKLLILEHYDKDRRKYERLQRLYGSSSDTDEKRSHKRPKIPERVRIEVWRRDDGKCAKCGSRERLEYDHIIPISKGGSNTARNIELLCEKCNRSKGAKIE